MKKKLILIVMIVLTILACTIFISGGLTYLITSLMALVIMGTIYLNRSWAMRMTRWAKTNPKKTQCLIASLQITLLVLGIFAGYNIKELGYELPGSTAFVFSAISAIGFLSVHFLPKRNTIVITKEVNRHRIAYMCIALSSFVMMVLFGNKLEDRFPNSPLTHVVKAIDQKIFPDITTLNEGNYDIVSEPDLNLNNDLSLTHESNAKAVFASFTVYNNETIIPPPVSQKETKSNLKAEKKAKKFEKKTMKLMNHLGKKRMSLAAGLTTGAVFLIILLVLATCAGACLIAGGIAVLIDGGIGGLFAILGGIGIGWLSIRGIGKVAERDKEKQKAEPKDKQKTDPKL